MPSAVNDLVTAFKIRELTGPKRVVTLRERALPYRPFELSGEQRNSVDWYNGSPVGTVQVFGAKENQTTIAGAWKDIFLGQGGTPMAELDDTGAQVTDDSDSSSSTASAITTARDLADAVDSIRRGGQEIEVTWLGHVRRGILEKFTQKWQTGHDVDWEITFTWSSQGEDLDDVAFRDDTASDLHDLPNKVHAEMSELAIDSSEVVPQAGDRAADLSVAIGEATDTIFDLGAELTDAVASVGQVLTQPNEALFRVAGILDGIKLRSDQLAIQLCDIADGVALDGGGEWALNAVAQTFGALLGSRADNRARARSATSLRDVAAREQYAILNRLTSSVVQVFQARDGQDLRQVSQQFYGTPDGWRGLMIYNRLSGSGLVAGQVVLVPAQPPDGSC